jgi:mRNA interferase MazF
MNQYDVILVQLDPTIGSEIQKTRPCVIISPYEMNKTLKTIIIAPMTTKSHDFPSRVPLTFLEKNAWIMLDQIRTIDKRRVVRILGRIDTNAVARLKYIISEMLVE